MSLPKFKIYNRVLPHLTESPTQVDRLLPQLSNPTTTTALHPLSAISDSLRCPAAAVVLGDMGKQVFLFCKFDGRTCVINLSENYTYDQLVDKIRSRWSGLASVSFSLRYSLPGINSIFLDNDEDLENLFILAEMENIKRVEVSVNTIELVEVFVSTTGKNVKESVGAVITDEDNDQMNVGSYPDGEPDRLSEYSSHQENQFLSAHWRELIKEVGQVFKGGAAQLRNDLSKYSIEVGFEYILDKNDSTRVTAVCKHRAEKRCMWRLHARQLSNGSFKIREFNNVHICGAMVRKLKNKRMSSDLIASEILDEARDNSRISPVDVVKRFKTTYGLDITYHNAWLGVQKAMKRAQDST